VYGFIDDFESYIPGQRLACQDTINWTTWNLIPCDPNEDPVITTDYRATGTKSVKIVSGNDLVKPISSDTLFLNYINFWIYIPEGKTGYFNTLAVFDGINSNWGMECFFDAGGFGYIYGGSSTPVYFNWAENDWQFVELKIDLFRDSAHFYFDGNLIHNWQWTAGAYGSGSPLSIEANDFFGYYSYNEMYLDNYVCMIVPLTIVPLNAPTNLNAEEIFNPYPQVKLTWQDNSSYFEYAFNILRKDGHPSVPGSFESIGAVPANTTVFIDSTVFVDSTYTYAVFAYNELGFSDTSNHETIILNPVNLTPVNQVVNSFSLWQNYPNPFNPSTNIGFRIADRGFVSLKVYDVLGNEIATLVNQDLSAGEYEVEFSATEFSSGIYFYRLQSGTFIDTKWMVLLK